MPNENENDKEKDDKAKEAAAKEAAAKEASKPQAGKKYVHIKDGAPSKGKVFTLKIDKDEPKGRTHTAVSEPVLGPKPNGNSPKDAPQPIIHPGHTWQGTEAEFRQEFEKE